MAVTIRATDQIWKVQINILHSIQIKQLLMAAIIRATDQIGKVQNT